MIEYEEKGGKWLVYLDGRRVGEIRVVQGGFQYFTRGSRHGGEVFPTLPLCKKSLESDE
jgi:hypothetical protein